MTPGKGRALPMYGGPERLSVDQVDHLYRFLHGLPVDRGNCRR